MNRFFVRERDRERERRRRRVRERRRRRGNNNNDNYDDDYDDDYYNDYDEYYDDEANLIEPSLENLLLTPNMDNIDDDNIEIEEDEDIENNLTLTKFKKKHIKNLYEDMLYYFSSPEILKKYKSSIEEEKNYDFYKDIDSQNFINEQNERIKTILALPKMKLDSVVKSRKLVDYENIFFAKPEQLKINEENKKKFRNINSLRVKMEKCSNLCINENVEVKILSYLNELQEEFKKNLLDIKILGLVHFNFIENNLVLLLTLVTKKLDQNKNKKNINDFLIICSNILKYFKSSKLLFFIIKYSKQYIDILEILETKDDLVQFIPNNMIDFEKVETIENIKYICNLDEILTNKNIKVNYFTLIYDNYLLIFFDMGNYFQKSEDIYYTYVKIHLIDRKIVYKGKIDIDKKSNIKIIDINITIKYDIIYFLSIVEKGKVYCFKFILLNKFSLNIIKNGEIQLNKENFEPFLLLNDNKYFYCLSKKNNLMLIMKKNYKLDNLKYIQYNLASSIKNDFSFFTSFKNYNSLFFNNLFEVNNTSDKKNYFIKLLKNKDDNYLLNFYKLEPQPNELDELIKIVYNENKCIITDIDNDANSLYISICSQNNYFFDYKGILLLPFNS